MSKNFRTSGFTLLELLVGLAASSIIFLAAGVIFFRGVDLSSTFFRSAATMEQISDGITQLSSVMPQVLQINECNCSAAGASSASTCTWSEGDEWRDPVFEGGVATGSVIFDATYEHGWGGSGVGVGQYLSTDQTLTSFYPVGLCEAAHPGATAPGNITSRGCRRRLRLVYTAATEANAGTGVVSNPGELQIQFNDTGWAGTPSVLRIGSLQRSAGASVGLVRMSCGFATPAAGQVGTDFVINLRTKIKSSSVEAIDSDVATESNNPYEGWHENDPNFDKGFFREAKLRFTFYNLSQRGAYQWRLLSNKLCKISGEAAGSREECCSFALGSDGMCAIACVRADEEGDASECCSERSVAGTCT